MSKPCPICVRDAAVAEDIGEFISVAFQYIGMFGQNANGTITFTRNPQRNDKKEATHAE